MRGPKLLQIAMFDSGLDEAAFKLLSQTGLYRETDASCILSIGFISEPMGARFGSDEISGYALGKKWTAGRALVLRGRETIR